MEESNIIIGERYDFWYFKQKKNSLQNFINILDKTKKGVCIVG
jgi:hypothetical protein